MKFSTVLAAAAALLAAVGAASAQVNSCIEDVNRPGRFIDRVTGQECVTTIQTAVPFLTITPDARAGALGDAGLALSPTAAASYFNASMLAFSDKRLEVQANFTPWLRALNLNDVYLADLLGYGKLNDRETVHASLRYFSLGTIDFTDVNGQPISTGKPYEMSVAAGYVRKLSDEWSAGLTGRYILSSLANGLTVPGTTEEIGNGQSFAADISASLVKDLNLGNRGATLRSALVFRNIGSKITYTNNLQRDFLPTTLGLGGSLETFFDDFNSLTIALDFNKLLVPSPQSEFVDADNNGVADYLDQSPIEGLFSSFGDAQGGFDEELREINISTGLEYWYADQFAARVGYFHEADTKGGRQYLTVGVGVRYNVLGLDFSYLVPTTQVRNPLDNTLRFGVSYVFESEDDGTAQP